MFRQRLLAAAILGSLLIALSASAQAQETITITKTEKKSDVVPPGITIHWIVIEGTFTGPQPLNEIRAQRIVGDPPMWQDWGSNNGMNMNYNAGTKTGTFTKLNTTPSYTAVNVTIRVRGYRAGMVVSTSPDVNVTYP